MRYALAVPPAGQAYRLLTSRTVRNARTAAAVEASKAGISLLAGIDHRAKGLELFVQFPDIVAPVRKLSVALISGMGLGLALFSFAQ
jgi:hypothetical protein